MANEQPPQQQNFVIVVIVLQPLPVVAVGTVGVVEIVDDKQFEDSFDAGHTRPRRNFARHRFQQTAACFAGVVVDSRAPRCCLDCLFVAAAPVAVDCNCLKLTAEVIL